MSIPAWEPDDELVAECAVVMARDGWHDFDLVDSETRARRVDIVTRDAGTVLRAAVASGALIPREDVAELVAAAGAITGNVLASMMRPEADEVPVLGAALDRLRAALTRFTEGENE